MTKGVGLDLRGTGTGTAHRNPAAPHSGWLQKPEPWTLTPIGMIPQTRTIANLRGAEIPMARISPDHDAGTILIADADPHLRDIYRAVLHFHGHHVVEVADGLDAIEAVRKIAPAAALFDADLPHLSGLEAAGLLSRHPTTTSTRIILLSVYTDPLAHARALRAGCAGYVCKPFDPCDLISEVQRVLAPPRGILESV